MSIGGPGIVCSVNGLQSKYEALSSVLRVHGKNL